MEKGLISATWQLERKKETPFELDVKHILGRKAQRWMLGLRCMVGR
jgi:hypothetical protein